VQSGSCPSCFTHTEKAPVHRLDCPQRWYGCLGEKENLLPLLGYEPQFLSPPSCSLVTMQTVILACINSLTYEHVHMHPQIHGLPVMGEWTVLVLSPLFSFTVNLQVLQTVHCHTHKHQSALPTFLLR